MPDVDPLNKNTVEDIGAEISPTPPPVEEQLGDYNLGISPIVKDIKSTNYEPQTKGWKLDSNGQTDFNDHIDEVYGSNWNGSLGIPTKNALYDKIEAVVASIPAGGFSLLGSGTFNSTATTDTFTANATTDRITSTSAHNLNNGDMVSFTTTTTLPAPLTAGTVYFVKNAGATDFQVSQGSPFDTTVDITDTGTGTHTWTNFGGVMQVTFTAKTNLKIIVNGIDVTNLGGNAYSMQFNHDGGTNYGSQITKNGANSGSSSSAKTLGINGGGSAANIYVDMNIRNTSTLRKMGTFLGTNISTGTTVSDINTGGVVWNNTTNQITNVLVYANAYNAGFGTGSIIYVYGSD